MTDQNALAILHLSDLHYGPGTSEDVDWKVFIDHAERQSRCQRLTQWIRDLPRTPDYVVVSGDLTIAGHEEGFREFAQAFAGLMEEGVLPSAQRIIVVPGNHDVTRTDKSGVAGAKARWANFARHVAPNYLRPWIAAIDPPVNQVMALIKNYVWDTENVLGAALHRVDPIRDVRVTQRLPFVYNRSEKILLYAFNSASASGTRILLPDDVQANVDWLRQNRDANSDKVISVLDALAAQVWVDPARIAPSELDLFNQVMMFLGDRAGEELAGAVKIAVLHHHVAPMVREEVKEFELLLNAGKFKAELYEAGFHLVLHGHKHDPTAFLDTSVPGGGALIVVCGGTVGGGEARGKEPGFYWLEIPSDRASVLARYVDLSDIGNTRRSWAKAVVRTLPIPRGIASVAESLSPAGQASRAALDIRTLQREIHEVLLTLQRVQQVPGGTTWRGWAHRLDDRHVSMIATAYGLQMMRMLGSSLESFSGDSVLDTLLQMRLDDGCWSASTQAPEGRPDATAYALAALEAWGCFEEVGAGVQAFERAFTPDRDPIFWQRTTSLALASRILAKVAPSSTVLQQVVEGLLGARREDADGRGTHWGAMASGQNQEATGNDPPSVVHTAQATWALAQVHRASSGRLGGGADLLQSCARWLLHQSDWPNSEESIYRPRPDGKFDPYFIRHFTPPWVILALLECDVDPGDTRILTAVRELYEMRQGGLWTWGGERRIWATADALQALTEFALRATRL